MGCDSQLLLVYAKNNKAFVSPFIAVWQTYNNALSYPPNWLAAFGGLYEHGVRLKTQMKSSIYCDHQSS